MTTGGLMQATDGAKSAASAPQRDKRCLNDCARGTARQYRPPRIRYPMRAIIVIAGSTPLLRPPACPGTTASAAHGSCQRSRRSNGLRAVFTTRRSPHRRLDQYQDCPRQPPGKSGKMLPATSPAESVPGCASPDPYTTYHTLSAKYRARESDAIAESRKMVGGRGRLLGLALCL